MVEDKSFGNLDVRTVPAKSRSYSARVHQAIGMVAAQAECSVGTALALIIEHAAPCGCTVEQMARAVVERRVRFDGPFLAS